MEEMEKSLRVFFGIIALLLFSQVIGSGLSNGNIWLLMFSAVIIFSGILGFIDKLDKIVMMLDVIILVGTIITWVIFSKTWPLYLLYVAYSVAQFVLSWYWIRHEDENDEKDA